MLRTLKFTHWIRSRSFNRAKEALLDLLSRYFRAEIRGIEHIPKKGPAVLIANHSGYAAADAALLAHLIHRKLGREPRIMAHRAYFEWFPWLKETSYFLKLREPHLGQAIRTLKHGHLLIVFPEGEAGNFKSSLKRYHLQPFHSGFAQLARRARVPIIPCLITGSEEAYLNWGSISLERLMPHLRLPIPVNFLPFPAKWRIRILKPIPSGRLRGREDITRLRNQMQQGLRHELDRRSYIYFRRFL